jgi:hypothetical protein
LTPSQPEYTKTPPQTGGSFHFLIEKSPKTVFFTQKVLGVIYVRSHPGMMG